jgi:hypothetical protein
MLVQALASEAQAARGFWGGPGKKKVENYCWQLEGSSTSSRWASSRAEEGLEEQKILSMMLIILLIIMLRTEWERLLQ